MLLCVSMLPAQMQNMTALSHSPERESLLSTSDCRSIPHCEAESG